MPARIRCCLHTCAAIAATILATEAFAAIECASVESRSGWESEEIRLYLDGLRDGYFYAATRMRPPPGSNLSATETVQLAIGLVNIDRDRFRSWIQEECKNDPSSTLTEAFERVLGRYGGPISRRGAGIRKRNR